MNGRRVSIAACLAAVVAATSAGAAGRGEAAKKPPASQAVVAKQLANRVTTARTPAARYRALLAAMRALHLGVYTAGGKVVVRGAERRASDFSLYDFEVRALAGALARGERKALAVVAEELALVGVRRRGGGTLVASELQEILTSGVRRAVARPRSRLSLAPLLVRELGLRARPRVDLARGTQPEGLSLDALQAFVVLADGALRPRSRATASRSSHATTGGRCPRHAPAKLSVTFGGWSWDVDVTQLDGHTDTQFRELHKALLTYALEVVDLTPGLRATHYGPAGHEGDAGKQLVFEVAVRMTVSVPRAIRCGFLAGREVPAAGAVDDLPVEWSSVLYGESGPAGDPLQKHLRYVEASPTTREGRARYTAPPKDETVPGFGRERTAAGRLDLEIVPPAEPGSHPAELVYIGKKVSWPVEIRYHKPRGLKFTQQSPAHFEYEVDTGQGAQVQTVDVDTAGRVCSGDPYAKPWDVSTHYVTSSAGPLGDGRIEFTFIWPTTLVPGASGGPVGGVEPPPGAGFLPFLRFEPGSTPTMEIAVQRVSPSRYEPDRVTTRVPVEEDMSCQEDD